MKGLLLLCLWASLSLATESILGDDTESDVGSAEGTENYKLDCVNPYTACDQDMKFCCPPGVECVDGKCPFEALENAGFVKFGKLVGRNGEVIEIGE